MSYFPYPTPPLRSGVICLRGETMAGNFDIEGFPTAEAEEELSDNRGEDDDEEGGD